MIPSQIEDAFADDKIRRETIERSLQEIVDSLYQLTLRRDGLRTALKAIEAGIWVNGGTGGIVIDGKNEKIRESQFTLAAHRDPLWAKTSAELGEVNANIDAVERDIDLKRSALRAKEIQMAFRVEQMSYLATPRFYKET